MFKSIQWKVLTVFVLLIISVMIAVGTFLLNSVSDYYHDEFKKQMEKTVFVPDLKAQLSNAANGQNHISDIKDLLSVYSGRIGLDSFRNYYILDGKTALIYYGSNGSEGTSIPITQNILFAMGGKVGDTVSKASATMDYAYPIEKDNNIIYIVYISDTKEELYGIMGNIYTIIFWAMFLGLAISVVMGLFLSRTIISPIASLTKKAERMASGDFEQKIEVKSKDEIGHLTGAFNTMASELSKTLTDIAREKNKIETIFLFMTDGVVAFNRDGSVLHINPAAKKMLGIGDEEIVFDEFFKGLNIDITIAQIIYLEHYNTIEKNIIAKDKHLKAFFAPFMMGEKTDGVVVVFQDITEQEKLDMERREFVANVSHELRTPLTTVKSYAETLMENAEKGSMEANFLDVINIEADRMTRIVKDLLTLSRLDYDRSKLNKTTFSLQNLVRDIVRKLSIDAKNHNNEISFEQTNEIPPFFGDRDRLEQVMTNIISNAVKYTPGGGKITVNCGYQYTDAIITVTDTGIGIPKEDISRIFERFYRVDKARSRKFGGTGLGLAIAKEIIDAHSGKIEIESTQGKGTKVTVKIPIYSA